MTQQRTPKGVPTGGQFSASRHDESDVALVDPTVVEMDGLRDDQVEDVCASYLEAAVWSSSVTPDDDEAHPDDGVEEATGDPEPVEADTYELSEGARQTLRSEAAKAWNTMPEDLRETLIDHDIDLSQWGHDMWLTREGHGTGFWDRGETTYVNPEIRARLTEHAHQAGEGGNFWVDGNNELDYER